MIIDYLIATPLTAGDHIQKNTNKKNRPNTKN